MKPPLSDAVDFRQLELNALLEITKAINNNLPEESLYKIFHFTLRSNLIIKKLALFIFDHIWECKTHFGLQHPIANINLQIFDNHPQNSWIVNKGEYGDVVDEFDVLIPIAHKNRILAYIFADGDETFGEHAKKEKFNFIETVGNILMVAIENKRFGRKQLEQEALRKELEIAAQVQSMLFPKKLPSTEHFDFAATYIPHHSIGGDYYDYIKVDKNKFFVCIGDVSGKGVPAAIYMSNFQATLRTLVYQRLSLHDIVKQLNHLTKINTGGDYFVTFFIALINIENSSIEYVNAGHNAPILFNNDHLEFLEVGTTILGALDILPFINIGTLNYTTGTLLFMYTDGITETENSLGEAFEIQRITDFLQKDNLNLKDKHNSLINTLNDFKGSEMRYKDDITLFSCLLK